MLRQGVVRRPIGPSARLLFCCETAIALVLATVGGSSTRADPVFAVVGDYGSGLSSSSNVPTSDAVMAAASRGVAARLNNQNPDFVLSLGDQLYGPFPVPTGASGHIETVPLAANDASGWNYGSAVGALYGRYILPNSALVGTYTSAANIAAGATPGSSTTMRFFPVLGDHDWRHETIQVNPATLMPVTTQPVSGRQYTYNPNTDAIIAANQPFYNAAQAANNNTVLNPPNQPGLANGQLEATIFGSPNTTANGDSYETYFSGLRNLPTSRTPSGSIRWYDTVQGPVQVFSISNDANELYQGGLATINIQNSAASQINLAATQQGQWFQQALAASTATWRIVQMHDPVATATGAGGHTSNPYTQWFDNTSIDIVLGGHVHGYERLFNNGVVYINNGVGGTFEEFAQFCNQRVPSGQTLSTTCSNTYQVTPAFAGSSNTTFNNSGMVAFTQMQVGNTYGFQLVSIDQQNNFLRSQFFGSVDPGNVNGNGEPSSARWVLLDDFFILKNGMLNRSQAETATGLMLKRPNGSSTGFGAINTEGQTVTLHALIQGSGQLVVTGGGTLVLDRPQQAAGWRTSGIGVAPDAGSSDPWQFVPDEAVNNFSGGTAVIGGTTLQISRDGLLGAASGSLTLDGGTLQVTDALTSARAVVLGSGNGGVDTNGHAVKLTGTISGMGGLIKSGVGTLTLTAANTYTGGTAVSQGTLQIGDGGATGSLLGNVVNNGTLAFNLTSNTNFTGSVSGSGALRNEGNGTLTLAGSNTYTGATTVNAGTLLVNGSIAASSAVAVESGAALGGAGTVSTTTVKSGATLSPGSSIGTLTVSGNLTLNGGSTYAAELGAITADRVAVTSAASLGGSTLVATATGLSFQPQNFTIVNANGGVSGTFTGLANNAKVTIGGPFGALVANPRIVYGTTSATIVTDGATAGALGTLLGSGTQNQQSVSQGIGNAIAAGNTPPVAFSALLGMSGSQLGNALTQLSGPAPTGGVQASTQMMNAFLSLMLNPFAGAPAGNPGALGYARGLGAADELPSGAADAYAAVTPRDAGMAPGQRWSVWGQAFGGTNRTNGDPNVGSADITARAYGFALGADYRLAPGTLVGFALAGGGTSWSLSGGLGSGKADVFQAGLFASKQFGNAYIAGALSYAWHDMSTDRTVTVGGISHLTAGFNANSIGGRLEAGYRLAAAPFRVTPYAALQVQAFDTPAYGETAVSGSNAFALAYASRTATVTRTELGAWVDNVLPLDRGSALVLRSRLAWAHDRSSSAGVTALFHSLPGSSFTVNGPSLAPNSALVSAGAELRLGNNWSLGARFDGEFASTAQTYAGTATLRTAW